ncbi:ATP-binding cassette domain-containing protein [Massilia sp. W12]|uniref:ABC transporter ATP-binding protein n=1 Tax=Massilia sp. W12 TaxID=3126507 RepID=UPI0030D449AA
MLELHHITFHYPGRSIFLGLDAAFSPGIHWLQGENGCGKSTLLKLAGAGLQPHAGELRWQGISSKDGQAWRARVFLCQGEAVELPWLQAQEWLELHLSLYCDAATRAATQTRLHAMLQMFGLLPVLRQNLESLSLGQHKKLQLSLALALPVSVLLLDEPLNSLDVQARALLLQTLREQPPTRCILLTSHLSPDLPMAGVWRLQTQEAGHALLQRLE